MNIVPNSVHNYIESRCTFGVSKALLKVIRELTYLTIHFGGLMRASSYKNARHLKLNLGSGSKPLQGWLNVDLVDKADLNLDLRRPIPLPDESCLLIYSEHFFEHVEYPDRVTSLMRECFRLLEQGGIVSIAVPDTEGVMHAYVEGPKAEYFSLVKHRWHPDWCSTRMEHINYHFRMDNKHKFAYDFETMKHLMEKCGFVDVENRMFNPELDSEERRVGTLYVNAVKPRHSSENNEMLPNS